MYDECSNPVCGTLGLMIGFGEVVLTPVDDETRAAVRCRWKRRSGEPLEGFGSDWREAVKDCCEKDRDG